MFSKKINLFLNLLKTELTIVCKDLHNGILDVCIWSGMSIFANAYILPALGVAEQFGAFVAMGNVVSCGVFEAFNSSITLVGDFSGDKNINYELSLPLPAWAVFLKFGLSRAIKNFICALIILPLAKLILLNKLSFINFCLPAFLVSAMLSSLFCGLAVVFVASIPRNLFEFERVWVRCIFPVWFLGGSIFPYPAVVTKLPYLAMLLFFNPIVHATEAVRASVLGEGTYYLPLYVTLPMLALFSILIFLWGYWRLKKRLDFI